MIRFDLRGKGCLALTTEVYRALQHLAPGESIEVQSDFAPARATVPSLATDFGCGSELRDGEGGTFTIVIEKPAARH